MEHKIRGNDIIQPVKHLKVNNNSITNTQEIANTLLNRFLIGHIQLTYSYLIKNNPQTVTTVNLC